jgi:hypothetical protein
MFIVNLVKDSVSVLFGFGIEKGCLLDRRARKEDWSALHEGSLHCVEGKPILCGGPASSS